MTITEPKNPYVGPRPFRIEEQHRFYGRENEANDLIPLVIARQFVLFYAQSGAGKSSLINTRLTPGLEMRNFLVLKIGRVSGYAKDTEQTGNIFMYNLLLSLEKDGSRAEQLRNMSLVEYLQTIHRDTPVLPSVPEKPSPIDAVPIINGRRPLALIIDQFEEIFTTHLGSWQQRASFFEQINGAMIKDPNLWVVLTIREDYVPALDPYAHLLAGRMRARFYMQRMSDEAALEAISGPARPYRPFAPGVAEKLVASLRKVAVGTDEQGNPTYVEGEYIEPVQLQVVCYQLWEQLKGERGKPITEEDLINLARGDLTNFISRAVADFYEQAIRKVLHDLEGSGKRIYERDLRDWFSKQMITEQETRGTVPRGIAETGGLPNTAVDMLAKVSIVRFENRAGGQWCELIHDRFIGPILQANRAWEVQHPRPFLKDAEEWEKNSRDKSRLYEGKQLQEALVRQKEHPDDVGELEQEFLSASQQQVTKKRSQLLVVLLIIFGALAVAFATTAIFAVIQFNAARANEQRAIASEGKAKNNAATAIAAQVLEYQQRMLAEAASGIAINQATTAEAAKILEAEERQKADAARATAEAAKEAAVVQKVAAENAQATAQVASTLAKASELSSLSDYFRDKDLDLSLKLAVEAVRRSENWETRKSLLDGLQRGVANRATIAANFQPACEDPLSLAFNPNGELIATGCFDGRVNLWNTESLGKARQTPGLFAGENPVYAVAFDNDGRVLAAGSTEPQIRFWDTQTDEVSYFTVFRGAYNSITGLAYQPGGTLLAITSKRLAGDEGKIILYDPENKEEVYRWGCGPYDCTALAWSPDGTKLAVGNQIGDILILLARSSGEIGSIRPAHTDNITGIAWYPDSHRLVSGGLDGRLRQWDTQTGLMLKEANPRSTPLIKGLALSSNGYSLVTGTMKGPPWVTFWSGEDLVRNETDKQGHTQSITAVTVNSQGSRFATASLDNTVTMWNFEPLDPLGIKGTKLAKSHVQAIGMNASGSIILARTSVENHLELWEEGIPEPTTYKYTFTRMALTEANGRRMIAMGDVAGKVSFINAGTGKLTGEVIQVEKRPIGLLAFSGDGKLLAMATCSEPNKNCNKIILWNREQNQLNAVQAGIENLDFTDITSIAFSQDGGVLAIGGKPVNKDESFKIIFLHTGTGELTPAVTEGLGLKDATLNVTSLAFGLTEDNLLAAGFNDGRIALWEANSYNPVGEFNDWKEGPVTGLLFMKRGQFSKLISTTDYGQLVEWEIETESWVSKACKIAGGPLTTAQKIRFLYDENAPDICSR